MAVDSSAAAWRSGQCRPQRHANLLTVEANVFDLLKSMDQARTVRHGHPGPPRVRQEPDEVEGAVRGYKEINLRAMKLLRPGGILISCTCSYHIHEADFEEILGAAAVDAGVSATVVEKRRQARDHPVVLGVPETYYLKCFVLRKLG